VIVTHHLEELLPHTENVLLLDGTGKVVAAGDPDGVFTEGNLSAAYGVAVHVAKRHGRFSAHVNPDAWKEMVE
jgi:iron complex transport system ATP-binding protein